jgi:hypothetical protein
LGGVESGEKTLTEPREKVMEVMKKDLVTLRKWLTVAGLL